MTTRREFLLQTTATTGAALAFASGNASAETTVQSAPRSMRVLILGGTGFIGPHFVAAAVNRGHKVSEFSRGKEGTELPSAVERLVGDRNGDLTAIKNRDWDAVLDLATMFFPNWVRTLGQALHGPVKHYTFISSTLAYVFPGARDERSPVNSYKGTVDPYTLNSLPDGSTLDQVGALKVLCEREAEKQFPGRALIVRPGLIVGPREHVAACTYWAMRMQRGGDVLAAGDPLIPVQLIDVRDLAEWTVRMAEGGTTGTFNAIGPAWPVGWGEMLGGFRAASPAPVKLNWVPLQWLLQRKLGPWSSFLFFPSEAGIPGNWKLSNDKARASGLTFRPLNVTITDTLAWYNNLSAERQQQVLLSLEDPNTTWNDLMAREQKLLAAWHAHTNTPAG
jgi:2'-hydroxyisoflavone reductase